MRQGIGLAATVLLLLLAGCQKPTPIGGKPLPKLYIKVVSLSPSTTEIIGQYDVPDRLTGRTASCNFPTGLDNVPVMGGVKPDYEKLAKAKPDLIVYDRAVYGEADIQKLKELGIDTFEMDVHTVDGLIDWLYRYGAIGPDPLKFAEYADRIYQARQLAKAEALVPPARVAVLLGGSGEYLIAGKGTFQADIVRALGAEPVGPYAKAFVPASIEQLVKDNPDCIVTGKGDAAQVLRDPRLATVRAVRQGRVAGIDKDVLLRAGARVDQLIRTLQTFVNAPPPNP